ncbi:putative fatty acyl-CoA reductase [Armadillidium vulgare]|nr:putative fatty acyl-CoA reductase [Armadillidium vulgare]
MTSLLCDDVILRMTSLLCDDVASCSIRIKATQPEVIQKVVAIKGDVTMEGLGISDEDEARLAEEEPMRVAVNLNILGTKRVVSLAKKMTNLKAFVHVSTAYGNCHLPTIDEKLYAPPIEASKLIQMTEWLDDDMLESLTNKLIHPRPNTYTYTKALAEHVLITDGANLPIVIIRPSIAAWNTDSKHYKHRNTDVPIYCASSTSEKPLVVEKLLTILKEIVWKVPLDSPLWYPGGSS